MTARQGGTYDVRCHTRADVEPLLPAWCALAERVPPRNPLAGPQAVLAWYDALLPEGDERVLAVTHPGDGLVAVLPLFVHRWLPGARWRGAPYRDAVRSLHLAGALLDPLLHEVSEPLLDPAHDRAALAAAVGWLHRHERWDWVDLELRDDQPWPEPRWLSDVGARPAIVPGAPVPQVCVPLDGDEPWRPRRNLRESLRRFRSRTARAGGEWALTSVAAGEPGWPAALADLRRLHGDRAGLDRGPGHADVLEVPSQGRLLEGLARRAPYAGATVHRVERDGRAVAALLTFAVGDTLWVSVSGVADEAWELSPVTALQEHALRRAEAEGRRRMLFSPGVDTAKLRWSDQLVTTRRFTLVGDRPGSARVYRAVGMLRAHRTITRELRRFGPVSDAVSGSQDSGVR
ncbi:GNAT family N-acetyltransferase [Lapillicoccus jejuensis]|uniref:CelD/BcsL family acetyltransferase involved in cellulose biosynthesis n=1 Tax=Lapillicoccus jejuensis TaxID=402171 RepID=A0A542E324_9MICO|nr:GNAT family N-acetyltransferase [Lapillicoccus jejuensis]TQJ09738.1 CelD/BcsL family acetyltransferase involved in cellulose biosynthesis [Lapillicoccus jejuensis]